MDIYQEIYWHIFWSENHLQKFKILGEEKKKKE